MNIPDNRDSPCNRSRGIRPETEEKYRQAIELYRSTQLSCAEICRISKVTVSGFQRYLSQYHRHLLLARYNITCNKEEACHIKLSQLRGQFPATRAKYKDAIEACGSLDYIEHNVSQIARRFGLNGTDLGRQLRTHYPGIIEWREKVRKRLGLNDNLPRGTRKVCKEQYAEAVKLLRADRYITVQEAAEFGLHPECFRQYLKEHEPELHASLGMVKTDKGGVMSDHSMGKYAEALQLYSTTTESIKSLARRFGFNDCAFGQFIRRHFPELHEQHKKLVQEKKKID